MNTSPNVFSANEIKVFIGEYINGDWKYERVKFKRNVNVEIPNDTRRVYDDLETVGYKKTISECELELETEFQGYNTGIFKYKDKNGLLVKLVIETIDSYYNTIYLYNWNPQQPDFSPGDEGEFTVSLSGSIDGIYSQEAIDDTYPGRITVKSLSIIGNNDYEQEITRVKISEEE